MVGMRMSEFMDKIYYGDEVEFKINDTTYFIQGTQKNGKYYLTVDYWNTTDGLFFMSMTKTLNVCGITRKPMLKS